MTTSAATCEPSLRETTGAGPGEPNLPTGERGAGGPGVLQHHQIDKRPLSLGVPERFVILLQATAQGISLSQCLNECSAPNLGCGIHLNLLEEPVLT